MRSNGAMEFRTPPSDFGRIGGEIRLLNEQGRIHELPMNISETMVATNAGYTEEMYRTSCRIFGGLGVRVWDGDYYLRRQIEPYDITINKMKDMYRYMSGHLEDYTLVKKWDYYMHGSLDEKDFESYARRILENSGREEVAAWTFLYNHDKSKREATLYVRTVFLEWTPNGRDILNYLYMVRNVEEQRKTTKNIK